MPAGRFVARLKSPQSRFKDILSGDRHPSDVAVALGVPSTTINNYINGATPSLKMALHVARILNRPVEDIWFIPDEGGQ